ncbi:MAG TPA: MBL fold metallo-hydrolase [Dehalococcoidia bacterium]|nr:MBL fold metallo-hydrolase [Dehalococcoidia bacterium]
MLRVINHRPRAYQNTLTTPFVGSCVEINTPEAHLLCDAGVFFFADREFINVLASKKEWQPGIDYPVLTAGHYHCLLSHGHTDHYAGLFALSPKTNIDVYAGDLTWRVFNDTAALLASKLKRKLVYPNVHHVGTLEHARLFHIGDCRITPIRVRHSIPDCWAFIVECGNMRLLYAPEFMDRFWLKEPELIRNIGTVVIGYMPDIAPDNYVKYSGKKKALVRGERGYLVFYVTPGENLESIEGCFQDSNRKTFVSPRVRNSLSLLPDHMKEEFPLLSEAPTFDERHIPAELGLVACNYAEMVSYLENLDIGVKALYIVSNDFSLSTFARGIKGEGQTGRFAKAIGELKRRGQFVDAFQSAHGSQKLVRELLTNLLCSRDRIRVMVTHATSNGRTSLHDAFGEQIELLDEFSV